MGLAYPAPAAIASIHDRLRRNFPGLCFSLRKRRSKGRLESLLTISTGFNCYVWSARNRCSDATSVHAGGANRLADMSVSDSRELTRLVASKNSLHSKVTARPSVVTSAMRPERRIDKHDVGLEPKKPQWLAKRRDERFRCNLDANLWRPVVNEMRMRLLWHPSPCTGVSLTRLSRCVQVASGCLHIRGFAAIHYLRLREMTMSIEIALRGRKVALDEVSEIRAVRVPPLMMKRQLAVVSELRRSVRSIAERVLPEDERWVFEQAGFVFARTAEDI